MTDDPNKHQNVLAAKLDVHQLATAMEAAANTVATALKFFSGVEREKVLYMAFSKLAASSAEVSTRTEQDAERRAAVDNLTAVIKAIDELETEHGGPLPL